MNVFIIDDERLARQELREMLANYKQVNILAEFDNSEEAIEAINSQKPDLIFLDIHMPGKDGFALLQSLNYVPNVIFVTAYDEYALKAFEVSALDYLVKPVEQARLKAAIEKIELLLEANPSNSNNDLLDENDQVFVKDGEKCWFVQLKDVRLFESEGNYVRVYFENYKPLILKSLNNLSERLNEKNFFRASRKHIVNLKWIDKIENWFNGGLMVTLKDGTKVEVSRRQSAKFKEMLSL
jgi:two-component system LytT family response regulator